MKITALETLRLAEFANLIWVRLHTDEGIVGLGETFMGPAAVEAYLHETVAPKLIGTDPLQIEARNASLGNYLGWRGSGVETRGNSAVDIALWDIFGRALGRPVCELLGGRARVSNVFVARAGVVDADGIARPAAQQLADRATHGATENIPQRDVDR